MLQSLTAECGSPVVALGVLKAVLLAPVWKKARSLPMDAGFAWWPELVWSLRFAQNRDLPRDFLRAH
jgi:hypothetical protein